MLQKIKSANFTPAVLWFWLFTSPLTAHASFIESTIGTAVVNDATASYYNPAGLIQLKQEQLILLGSTAKGRGTFAGQVIEAKTNVSQSGNADSTTQYLLPSGYYARPLSDKLTAGLALVSNAIDRNVEENSLLRYDQSGNQIHSLDIVPAAGFKLNDRLSVGAAVNLTVADFLLRPILGFPGLNIPDSQSRNKSDASSLGGDAGLLYKPTPSTTLGLNYRSAITYRFHGKSIFEGDPVIISRQYRFNFWIPARGVFSINHYFTSRLGVIATAQRIQWSIFNNLSIHGIATPFGSPSGIGDAIVPYHLHNAWLFTLGTHYRMTPQWVVRFASTYNQSPGNPHFQLANGDSIIVGASTSYQFAHNMTIEGSYAHGFIQNQPIHIANDRRLIEGVYKGKRDGVSMKLIVNL